MWTSERLSPDDFVAFSPTVTDYTTGRVGAPLICCEIKLKDWQEGKSVPQARVALDMLEMSAASGLPAPWDFSLLGGGHV